MKSERRIFALRLSALALLLMLGSTMFCVQSSAQLRFGFLSYETALKAMHQYGIAQKKLADLKQQYDAETKRAEDEFNKKYEEFLDGQREFAPTILQKRQAELQELLSRNLAFKQEAVRLLANAEADIMAPLRKQLSDALQKVGFARGLAFIINTDQNACPFINPEMGMDVTEDVNNLLNQ